MFSKERVDEIVADKDVVAALALMAESAELREPSSQWEALKLLQLIAGTGLERQVSGFFEEATEIWPAFVPMQSEIMQNSTDQKTVRAAACNILNVIAQRGQGGGFALSAWAINAALEALCLVGRPSDLALLAKVELPEGDEAVVRHTAMVGRLLPFLDGMSERMARRRTGPSGTLDCVICLHKPRRQKVGLTGPVFHIELGEIGLVAEDMLDAFAVRVFLRAVGLRIGDKGVLRDDRALVALQGKMGRDDMTAARLLAQLQSSLAQLSKGESLRGMAFVQPVGKFPSDDIDPGGAHVRGGNVELTAIECFLSDRAATLAAAERVVTDLWAARSAGAQIAPHGSLQLYGNRPEDAILRLCLQAGWYSTPGRAGADFAAWAEAYLAAFRGSRVVEGHNVYFLPVQPLGFPRLTTPVAFREARFFELLRGRRVVMVTAFAEEIANFHAAGNLGALWRTVGLDCAIEGLVTISAPFSIWPHYPGVGWQASWDALLAEAVDKMAQTGADLFLVAAGCYGAPLAHAIGERFPNALALHYGHHINTCFGVASGQTSLLRQFGRPHDPSLMIRSELGQRYPKTLDRADLHRYA